MADKQLTAQLNAFKDQWAKDLGYSDFKAYQKANKKDGTLQQRLERGEGVFESLGSVVGGKIKGIKEKAKSIKETFTTVKGFRKGLAGVIPGDNLLGAYVRGKVRGREKDSMPDMSSVSPSKMGGGDMSSFAKDVATIRQAVSTLLTFERESQEQSEKQKQSEFLAQQDAKEAELEASRVSPEPMSAKVTTPQGGGEESGGGIKNIFSNVIGNIIGGLKKGFKFLFQPSKLLKVLGKVFIIATIVISLFKGIMAGFDRWKETGSISEAIIAGLGAVVDFLSFGLLGEDTVRSVFDTVGGWIDKLKDTIVKTFYDVKDWIVNNVGIPQFSIPIPGIIKTAVKTLSAGKINIPEKITIGPWYPFKGDKESSEPEKTEPSKPSKPISERDMLKEKAKDILGMDITNMSEDEIEKMIPEGMDFLDFVETDGKLQLAGFDPTTPTQIVGQDMPLKTPSELAKSPTQSLDSLVQQYGGDEAVASMKKEQEGLNKFMEQGGIDKAMSEMGEKSSTVPQAIDQGISSLSEKIKSGGVETGPAMPNLGQQLGESSADVESGQRMESVPDIGNIFNAPSTTNNRGSMGKKKLPPADVFNSDFANVLMRT